ELGQREVGEPGDVTGVLGDRLAADLDLRDLVVDPALEAVLDDAGDHAVQRADRGDAGVVGGGDERVRGVGRELADGGDDQLGLGRQDRLDREVDRVDQRVRPGLRGDGI